MIITDKAKKFILDNLDNSDAIFINVNNDCCSVGSSIHIGFVNKSDFKNVLTVNDINVCYDEHSYKDIINLTIDYNGLGFTYED